VRCNTLRVERVLASLHFYTEQNTVEQCCLYAERITVRYLEVMSSTQMCLYAERITEQQVQRSNKLRLGFSSAHFKGNISSADVIIVQHTKYTLRGAYQ
jgi:hypothetical protein